MDNTFFISASREVLWNVGSLPNVVLMYTLFGLSAAVCAHGLWARLVLWSGGRPDNTRFGSLNKRFDGLWQDVLEQRSVQRDKTAKLFHNLIFWGFIVLLFTTTMVFVDQDLGFKIYRGHFYLIVTAMSDAFGFLLLLGIGKAFHRRYIEKLDRLHSTRADAVMLSLLALMVIQGFFLEALRIHATDDPWRWYSFVGNALSAALWPLSPAGSRLLHFVIWWFHTVTVFLFIAFIPYSKFFHILASSANLFFRELERPKGALKYPGDIEKLLETSLEDGNDAGFRLGVSTIEDLTWKQRLDLDACTSCGRCQDACPAYNSGKVLSPKWLILDARDHMLSLMTKGELAGPNTGAFAKLDRNLLSELVLDHDYSREHPNVPLEIRAQNPLVQRSAIRVGDSKDAKLGGEVMEEDVFWSCTTCRACMEACPVGIEHVDLILDVRRSLALMEGTLPAEAQNSLKAIETRGNPFGPADARGSWTEGLNVPVLKEGDEVDVLYWVGCVSAYDKRKQKIARSLATILNASGLSWGILGNRESCSGDPARRLGEENLWQSSAKKNIATLSSIRFKTVVANCPHCFNTLKNEYSQVGQIDARVVHHSEFIRELLSAGRIAVEQRFDETFTFHDPCYLSRYNDVIDEPREILVQLGKKAPVEMGRSREKALCCGAGGGHFWMDMKVGERVNVQRTEEAAATGAQVVATACPFCMQMIEDGSKLTNREDELRVRDIAELVSEALVV